MSCRGVFSYQTLEIMDAEIEKLNKEKEELNRMIQGGISFELECDAIRKTRGFLGFPHREIVKIKRTFKIEEITLSTLDRIGVESIELDIDEKRIKDGDDSIKVSRQIAIKHAKRMARVVAIAVLGSEWETPKVVRGDIVRYVENTKAIDELTELFAHAIKPSKLHQLCLAVNAMCNLSDFLNSTRLITIDRTTMPIRVEENRMD